MVATENYQALTPPETIVELELVKADVHLERALVNEEEVDEEFTHWILDTGTSHSRETKYHRTIDLYWHVKTLLGKVMTERSTAFNEILLQMEYLQLQIRAVDQKISLLAERTVGLDLNEPREDQPQVPEATVPSPPV
jgi:hypothetical protein